MYLFRAETMVYLLYFLKTGENIEILIDQNVIECGRKLTLTCKLENDLSLLSWVYENEVIAIANCVEHFCEMNPNYGKKYELTYDVDQGIFNLTIVKLTMSDIGRKLLCSNGFDSVSTTISLRDNTALLAEEKENKEITATSGCISPLEKVTANSNIASEFFPEIFQTNSTDCSSCGYNQRIQYRQVISVKESDRGNFFIKIAVVYGNETIESNITSSRYMFEEKEYIDDENSHKISGLVIVSTFIIVVPGVAFCLCKIRVRKHDRKKAKNETILDLTSEQQSGPESVRSTEITNR